jgi:hypothetical protein
MSKDGIWQTITGAVIVAIVFMVVRPGAPAAAAITQVSDALQALVTTSTGYTVAGQG